jgi:hypothetical protein
MRQTNHKFATCLLAATLAMSNMMISTQARADSYDNSETAPSGGAMLADTILVRPFMLVSTVAGLATFIVTLPFSALGGNVGEAGKTLVVEPAQYTFVRPLGAL